QVATDRWRSCPSPGSIGTRTRRVLTDPERPMPTYEYRCKDCGEHLEVVQKFTDDPLTVCPNCGGSLRKVFGNIGITFKGSGFYKTDNRAASSSSRSRDSDSGGKDSSSDSSSSSSSSSSPSDGGSADSGSKTAAKTA